MISDYREIPTPELERMWRIERDRLSRDKDAVVGDYDALFAMRRELDRRMGGANPGVNIEFTDEYLTD